MKRTTLRLFAALLAVVMLCIILPKPEKAMCSVEEENCCEMFGSGDCFDCCESALTRDYANCDSAYEMYQQECAVNPEWSPCATLDANYQNCIDAAESNHWTCDTQCVYCWVSDPNW